MLNESTPIGLIPMEPLTPIDTAPLFAPLHAQLISLLEQLSPDEWIRPTVAGGWQVRDVAAHLLDVDLRRLSVGRDHHQIDPGRPIAAYDDLVGFLNQLNAEWVAASRRISPRLLIELLRLTGPEMARLVTALPPHGEAPFAVAWAGEPRSEHWFDVGRDYTERWHHQMQIRDAVGAAPLLDRRWLLPLLDLSVRCLPRAYAAIAPTREVSITLQVTPEPDAVWTLRHPGATDLAQGVPLSQGRGWQVWRGGVVSPVTRIRVDRDSAWRLFYNALHPDQARQRAVIEGDTRLAEPLFRARAVMV